VRTLVIALRREKKKRGKMEKEKEGLVGEGVGLI
jgi:hypothetical protein